MSREPDARGSGDLSDPSDASGQNSGKRHVSDEPPAAPPGVEQAPLSAPITWVPASAQADVRARARGEALDGVGHYNRGQYAAALARFVGAVRLDPAEAEYHHMLGCTAERANRGELVEPHLLEAVRLDPRHVGAHTALGAWYADRGRTEAALRHSGVAFAATPNDPKVILTRASAHFAAGAKQETLQTLQPLLDQPVPQRWAAQLYARLAPDIGHEEKALATLDRALAAPNLSPTPDGRPLLLFAAAGLLERLGRYDEAFGRAREGNETVRMSRPEFDPASHSTRLSGAVRYFTKRRMRSLPRATHGNRRPVFIVGMPRSGTSLVEQILASHPEVFGAGELSTLSVIASGAARAEWSLGEQYPQFLDMISSRRANELAAQYLAVIESMNRTARYVTDKMPTNFAQLAIAEVLFPDCRVIHCVRNALDTCLSCFMSNFANGNEFAFDLSHLGSYYRDYTRLMEHWKHVLSLPMLEVRYEDVVLDTEAQMRRMLEFLELPWDERCLRFYENRRSVQTSSRDQVNRPIYVSSIGRWKFYEKHLGELIAALSTPAQAHRRAG